MPEDKPRPTNSEIDTVCRLYEEAQKEVENAIQIRDGFGDQIEEMVEQFGSIPPRARKSKRIKGHEYQATLSRGHSVEVDSEPVNAFYAWLKERKLSHLFRKLFKRETVFVFSEHAQVRANGIAARLTNKFGLTGVTGSEFLRLFSRCVSVTDNSPSLKVEKRKKESVK